MSVTFEPMFPRCNGSAHALVDTTGGVCVAGWGVAGESCSGNSCAREGAEPWASPPSTPSHPLLLPSALVPSGSNACEKEKIAEENEI